MRRTWTPSVVPSDLDVTLYIVESDFGPRGRAFTETDIDRADLESTIEDLISGQHGDPMRVIGFNTTARWSEDASADIAREIRRRFDLLGQDVPSHIQDFVERHDGRTPQLTLRLV
jgi:hypothetical protein